MSLYVGNTEVKNLYYGNKPVSAYCNGEWVWPNAPQAYSITYTMNSGMYEVAGPTSAYPGQTVYFAATPGPYQTFSGLTVNGQTAAKEYSFVMPNGNATVNVVGKDAASAITYGEVVFQFNSPSNFNPKTKWGKFSSMWTRISTSPNVWKFTDTENCDVNLNYMFGGGCGDVAGLTDWEILYGNMPAFNSVGNIFGYNAGLKKVHYLCVNGATTETNVLFWGCGNLTEAHVTLCNSNGMAGWFDSCSALKTVSVGDINASTYDRYNDKMTVGTIGDMFYGCSALKYLPIMRFNGNLYNADRAFMECPNVEGGIVSAYNRITADNNDVSHDRTFKYCGTNTSAGSAELAQIPSGWKEDIDE